LAIDCSTDGFAHPVPPADEATGSAVKRVLIVGLGWRVVLAAPPGEFERLHPLFECVSMSEFKVVSLMLIHVHEFVSNRFFDRCKPGSISRLL
jgi:hypothetical protein